MYPTSVNNMKALLREALNARFPCLEELVNAAIDCMNEARVQFYMHCNVWSFAERITADAFFVNSLTAPVDEAEACRGWKRTADAALKDEYGWLRRRDIFCFLSAMHWSEMRIIIMHERRERAAGIVRRQTLCQHFNAYCATTLIREAGEIVE